MITEEKLAEIVFTKGLGGRFIDEKLTPTIDIQCWEIILNKKKKSFTEKGVKDFIFSWPDPCAFGLVIDAAEKLHWRWQFYQGWFWFGKYSSYSCEEPKNTKRYVWKKDNPMWAVCLAFHEVLKVEGKL